MSVRTHIRMTLVATLAVGVLLISACSAGASEQTVFALTSFSPFGSFSFATGVAVDASTEEVLIADGSPANVVDVFGPAGGAPLGSVRESFNFAKEFAGVAVDNDPSSPSFHDLYVSDVKNNVVDKFRRTGPHAYEYLCHFNGWHGTGEEACSNGPPEESFSEPLGVTTDGAGDVYIASYEPGKGAVDEFDSTGKGVLRIIGSEHGSLSGHPQDVAVDSTGDIFVSNYEGGKAVTEFKRTSLTGGIEGENSITSAATSIAVDPVNNDLYVDYGSKIAWYQVSGAGGLVLAEEFGGGVLGGSMGVAVNGEIKTIYVSDADGTIADAFLRKAVIVPDVREACSASEVTATSARLDGEVNPLGTEDAQYAFEYGLTPYEQQGASTVLAGNGFRSVFTEVTGLTPGEIYHCRVNATDSEGLADGIVNHGTDGTFETLPLLPVVDEPSAFATEVSSEGAILNGFVKPGNGATTTYHFVVGRGTRRYTLVLPSVAIGKGFEPIAVEQAIPPATLRPGTTYHFALVATNRAGTTIGKDQAFRTISEGRAPEGLVVSTGPADSISLDAATITGVVFPEGTPTIYRFELGTTPAYGTIVYGGEAGREQELANVAVTVGGLQPGVTYHYRIVAENAAGSQAGPDRTFTTPALPLGIIQPSTPTLLPIPYFPPESPVRLTCKKGLVKKGNHCVHKKKHHARPKKRKKK